jgi:hypothetical protein
VAFVMLAPSSGDASRASLRMGWEPVVRLPT